MEQVGFYIDDVIDNIYCACTKRKRRKCGKSKIQGGIPEKHTSKKRGGKEKQVFDPVFYTKFFDVIS